MKHRINFLKPFINVLILITSLFILIFPLNGCASGKFKPSSSGSIEQALSIMPDFGLTTNSGDHFVGVIDYSAIRNKFNLPLPTSGYDQDYKNYIETYLKAEPVNDPAFPQFGGGYISGMGQYAEVTTVRKENIGFDFTDMDIDVWYQGPPGVTYEELLGNYDPQATKAALANRDKWFPTAIQNYRTEEYHNITINSWIDGTQINAFTLNNVLEPPISDNMGRLLPIAVTNGKVFYSSSVDNVKKMIDASINKSASLAGIQEYDAVAKGLDSLGAYCAIIGNDKLANNATDHFNDIGDAPLLKKYVAVGTGIGKDEKGAYMALVIAQDNSNAAIANAEILQKRIDNVAWNVQASASTVQKHTWKEYVSETQISVKGNAVLAKLYTTTPGLWEFLLSDPLLLHE